MSYKSKSLFVSFEGVDGAGKTTLIAGVAKQLSDKKYQLLCTREPGGTHCAEAVREILKTYASNINVETEALLFAAARADHVAQTIIPALKENKIVLCDRFVDSSLAYQGYGRKGSLEAIKACNDFATQNIYPDITFYLQVPEEVAQKRRIQRNQESTLFDTAGEAFFEQVRIGFKKIFEKRTNVVFLDATTSIETLINQTITAIEGMLETK